MAHYPVHEVELDGKVYTISNAQIGIIRQIQRDGEDARANRLIKKTAMKVRDSKSGKVEKDNFDDHAPEAVQGAIGSLGSCLSSSTTSYLRQ